MGKAVGGRPDPVRLQHPEGVDAAPGAAPARRHVKVFLMLFGVTTHSVQQKQASWRQSISAFSHPAIPKWFATCKIAPPPPQRPTFLRRFHRRRTAIVGYHLAPPHPVANWPSVRSAL